MGEPEQGLDLLVLAGVFFLESLDGLAVLRDALRDLLDLSAQPFGDHIEVAVKRIDPLAELGSNLILAVLEVGPQLASGFFEAALEVGS